MDYRNTSESFITEKGRAKINLYLEITGIQGSMHTLKSVVKFLPLENTVKLRKTFDGLSLRFESDWKAEIAPNESNAFKAAQKVLDRHNLPGAEIVITENIPSGEGLGGSSASAAAVVRGLTKLYALPQPSKAFLVSLGGDVPSQYFDCDCTVLGIGEEVLPIDLPKTNVVLLLGAGGVSTEKVFALYDKMAAEESVTFDSLGTSATIGGNGAVNRAEPIGNALSGQDLADMCYVEENTPRNDLTLAATELNLDVKKNLDILKDAGFRHYAMTGGGSGVFAIGEGAEFESALEKLLRYRQKDIMLFRNV